MDAPPRGGLPGTRAGREAVSASGRSGREVRAFVAVEVPEVPARSGGGAAPEHLTLHFLGEVDNDRVGPIAAALTPVAAEFAPFDLTLEGVGAFPARERPRVLWVGATEGATRLGQLADRLRHALSGEGEPSRERPFVAHLTILRVRSAADRQRADELLSGAVAAPAPRRFRVDAFLLKESVLSPRGATHRTVERFPLTGPASGGP